MDWKVLRDRNRDPLRLVCRIGAKTRGILNRSRRTLIIWEVSKRKKVFWKVHVFLPRSCFPNISDRNLISGAWFAGISCLFCCVFDSMVCLAGFQEEKGVLKSTCLFYLVLVFITFIIGNLFLEPDLREFRVYVVACSFRWFVW